MKKLSVRCNLRPRLISYGLWPQVANCCSENELRELASGAGRGLKLLVVHEPKILEGREGGEIHGVYILKLICYERENAVKEYTVTCKSSTVVKEQLTPKIELRASNYSTEVNLECFGPQGCRGFFFFLVLFWVLESLRARWMSL